MTRMTPDRELAEEVIARRPEIYRSLVKALPGSPSPRDLVSLFIAFHDDLVALGRAKLPAQPAVDPEARPLFDEPAPPRKPRKGDWTPSEFTVMVADSSAPEIVPQEWVDAWHAKLGHVVDVAMVLREADSYFTDNPHKRRLRKNLRATLGNWMTRRVGRSGGAPHAGGAPRMGAQPGPVVASPDAGPFESPAACPWLGEWYAYHLLRFPETAKWLAQQPNAAAIWRSWGNFMAVSTLAIAQGCTDLLVEGKLGVLYGVPQQTRAVWTEAARRGRDQAAKLAKAREAQREAEARGGEQRDESFSAAAEYRKALKARRGQPA